MPAITTTIKSEGRQLDINLPLLHFEALKELNRVPSATLSFADGSIAERSFALSQADDFAPGKSVELFIRREGQGESNTLLFAGIVTAQTIEADASGSRLNIELRDKAVKMTTRRRTAIFKDKKDSEVFSQLLENSGLETGTIEETDPVHPETVQYEATDWDFMLLRAEAAGQVVRVSDGKISVLKPTIANSARQRFEFGMSDILGFELRADAERQVAGVSASAWDFASQEMLDPQNASNFALAQGSALDPAQLAEAVGSAENPFATPAARPEAEVKAWADGRLMRSRLSLLRGWLTVIGRTDVAVLDTIELAGLSEKFNGRALVTGARQVYDAGGWRTDLQIGLPETPFAQANPDLQSLPAAGLLPAISGLHIGVVETFESDPERHYRVRVRVPGWQTGSEVVWARQLHPDAGNERGVFFYPEPGDEVVLGFLNDDPREALLLGSLHSESRPAAAVAPDALDENNYLKGIFTREGIQLKFDDETKTLTLQTTDSQKISLNGQDKIIEITDGNDNKITLSDSGITLKSGGDIKIEASGKVEIKGSTVDVK